MSDPKNNNEKKEKKIEIPLPTQADEISFDPSQTFLTIELLEESVSYTHLTLPTILRV